MDLELRFEEGCMCVAKRHAESADTMKRIVHAQVRFWQFKVFTESRWLSVGPRARGMVSSLLLGLHDFVVFCIQVKNCSTITWAASYWMIEFASSSVLQHCLRLFPRHHFSISFMMTDWSGSTTRYWRTSRWSSSVCSASRSRLGRCWRSSLGRLWSDSRIGSYIGAKFKQATCDGDSGI